MSSSEGRCLSEDVEAILTAACYEVFVENPDFASTEEKKIELIEYARKKLVKKGIQTVAELDFISREAWSKMRLPEKLFDKMRSLLVARTSTLKADDTNEVAIRPSGFSSIGSVGSTSSATDMLMASASVCIAKNELQTPCLAFGTYGDPIGLTVNHFELKVVVEPGRSIWVMWQLEFPPFTQPIWSAGAHATSSTQSPTKPREPREPGKELRQKAVAALLREMDSVDWLYDGFHCLYTVKDRPPRGVNTVNTVEVTGSRGGQLSIQVKIVPAISQTTQSRDQKTLDLRRISKKTNYEDANEELRFIAVAMRCHSIKNPKLAVIGRRVVCLGHPLGSGGQMALQHGRELWRGYLAQANLVGSRTGVMCTLSLNLVASVGIPQTSAIELIAKFLSRGKWNSYEWYKWKLEENTWPQELEKTMLNTLNSDAGLQKLRVSTRYFGHERRSSIVGITQASANEQTFEYEGRYISVAEYFKTVRGVTLKQPDLPCLELGKPKNFVPIELVTVLGGEHNILAGKMRPEYQADVVRQASMKPSDRRDAITKIMGDVEMGPTKALSEKGIDVKCNMLTVSGHILAPPRLIHGVRSNITPNSYAREVKAIAPPEYDVHWCLWCITKDKTTDMERFAREFERMGAERGITFKRKGSVGYPKHYWDSYYGNDWQRQDALRIDLQELVPNRQGSDAPLSLLVVVLPAEERYRKHFRACLKMITELELGGPFATQCIEGGGDPAKKLHTLMMKLPGKLPQRIANNGVRSGASHYVNLREPHQLLERRTMIIGADVTHKAAGVSVAGVVATQDQTYVTYFSELRGQTPFVLEGGKTRRRKSEERIIDLSSMVSSLLRKWQQPNDSHLPDVILYYRDGVSNGQFFDVLTREYNQLIEGFEQAGGRGYNPELVIIVGQKRHQTRLFRETASGKGKQGGGKGGKSSKGDPAQVPPGTVADDGIATPGHLNFYLVAHEGIMGTSVPCHYHVLHLDERLIKQHGIGIDDISRITYDLCHLYPRADKTVSYASPTYLADHLCERGKLYLETKYSDSGDWSSEVGSPEQEEKTREMIQTRVNWLNQAQADLREKGLDLMQGTNYFC